MTHEPNTELTALFPELRAHNHGEGIAVIDWLGTFGSIPHAIAYSTLFWPEFVEYEGCLLERPVNAANFDRWMVILAGDKTRVESVMNHRHLTGLFFSEQTPEQIEYLGKLLQKIWTLKLQNDFPLLNVRVAFDWHDREDDDDAQLTIYCQRDELT